MQPQKGNGQFQWNAGWFGGQIGGTAYLVILGLFLAFKDPIPGMIIFACGIVPNIVGCFMWKRRDKLDPYHSVQMLMLVIFIFTAIAYFTAARFSRHSEWEFISGSGSAWILLLFPGLMLWFYYFEQAGKKRMKSPTCASSGTP